MVKNSSSQNGSAFAVIIVILIVTIVGALGFVFWQNFTQSDKTKSNSIAAHENIAQKPEGLCATPSNIVEAGGVFCSEDIGAEFKIPEIFQGKFQKAENYDITEGSMENFKGNPAGKSAAIYVATVASGGDTLSLSVSKESIRSGYSSINHALQRTYFNAKNGNLHLVIGPTNEYDSATDTTTTTGGASVGESVPSFDASNTKVYHGKIGDAGVLEDGYLMAVKDHIVIIKIKLSGNPSDPVIDGAKPFADLNSYLKQLKVLK